MVAINRLDNIPTDFSRAWASLNIISRANNVESFDVKSLIMPSVSSQLASQCSREEQYSSFLTFNLIYPYFYTS